MLAWLLGFAFVEVETMEAPLADTFLGMYGGAYTGHDNADTATHWVRRWHT
jgi:hypothetical protein